MTAIELYRQGLPIKSIARKLDVSIATVGRMLASDESYEPARKNGTRLTCEQASKAAEMESQEYSWREISRTIGPSVNALKRAIKYYAAQRTIKSLLPRGQGCLSGGQE